MRVTLLVLLTAIVRIAAADPDPVQKLAIEDDDGKVTIVPVIRDELSIGRKEGNTIRLTQRDVSPRQARLRCSAAQCTIEDLESDNGTRVNGKRIAAPTALRDGDVVRIGGYRLVLFHGEQKKRPPAQLIGKAGTVALERDAITIGSAADNDIVFKDRSVAPHHARIERTGTRYRVLDLQSPTGVRVGGEDCYRMELVDGDEIEIGAVRLRFSAN